MRISLELLADDDRLQGHVVSEDGLIDLTFSGTLDLLRAIEELQLADRRATADRIDLADSPSESGLPTC